jgi:hypothetical protein
VAQKLITTRTAWELVPRPGIQALGDLAPEARLQTSPASAEA